MSIVPSMSSAPTIAERLAALEERIRPLPIPSLHEHYIETRTEWADELAAIRVEVEALGREILRGEYSVARGGDDAMPLVVRRSWLARLAPERP